MSEAPVDPVQDLFDRAVVLPPSRRSALLAAACRHDPGLRAEVESLLASDAEFDDGGDGPLESPVLRSPGPTTSEVDASSASGRPPGPRLRIGRYRILRRIAVGGMGSVYQAEQDSPRRLAALKVVRPDLAVPALLARFAHEAQILGRLQHPGIAQVYEAGLADDGQPYFAMEFIRGLPLDEYARHRRLNMRDRVALLALVCDAVQHAHDRGIVHRDLKPANILVEEAGQPKVLDFGVARITDAGLLTGAGLTRAGMLLGTPNYMSPEQMAGEPDGVDHRADVYALGVILFELTASRPPFRLENRPLAEAARLIQEEDPPRLGSIHAELRGDVETIVAKALEKDPTRRYASASDLATDIRRWLAHEPILARPSSTLYQLSKFARRNKGLVGGMIATAAALVLGLVGTILFAVAEGRQRGQAERNALAAGHEKREAQAQAYRARLAAAAAALQNHDVVDAGRQLDAASDELRDWEWRHLHSRLDDSISVARLPIAGAGHLLTAPDQLRVAAMTSEGIRISDMNGGVPEILPIRAERGRLVTVTQTRRGIRVAAWTADRAFELLDESGRRLCRAEVPGAGVPMPVIVSPDATRLACALIDGDRYRLAVFDACSGELKAVCGGHRDGICTYAFSPDGTRLVTGGEDRTACLWDSATGSNLATLRSHASKVLGAAFRPDGARLATTSSDGTVRQWDASTGCEVEAPYDRHSGEVVTAAYSPDGRWVASAGTDRTIRVWRATDRQDVAVLHGHTAAVTAVAFAPDGVSLASLSGPREGGVAWTGDDTARVWEADPRATLPALRGHARAVYPVAFSPDGRWLASGSWDTDAAVCLWDSATGEMCATLPHPGHVWSLAYSPDGSWLATGIGKDGRVRIWDAGTGRLRREIPLPDGTLRFLAVHPDGRRVAATAFDEQDNRHLLHIIDVDSGERLYSTPGWGLAYSPDGRWLAVLAADEKTVLLQDAQTHDRAARFVGHEGLVSRAVFSPDGRTLATSSRDRTVRLWDLAGGACRVLRGHTDEVFAVAFHPDGRRLATGGRDRAVWLWDLTRGEEVARLQGHASFVWSLAFSPDGSTLASGSGDATVRLWDTTPMKTRHQARREAIALRAESQRLVDHLWSEKDDPDAVVESLRSDRNLGEPLRQAALRSVLRRHAHPTTSGPPVGIPSARQ